MARDRQKGASPDRDAPPHGAPAPDLDAVSAAIRDAEGRDLLLSIGREDPAPGKELHGVRPGEWTPGPYGLPDDCPVLPLGTEDGMFYFLDTIGQLRVLKDGELGQSGINSLFMGRHQWLTWAFPKAVRDVITSWRPERVREALMGACARKGAWSPFNHVRGRGIWRGRDGRLILHCGDRLYSAEGEELLGELEGEVYPTRPPIARPWPVVLHGKPGPALKLLPHFSTWKWRRPELDPILLLGWIGIGYLGAALRHRPASYVLGDKGTGKSELQEDMRAVYGDWVVASADTTSAGIYQLLKFDCLPVAIDEFEAKADTRKVKAVVELMRLSYTGGALNRGGDSHKGTQFQGRSAFTFTSINMPPMDPQDLSRLAILKLRRQPPGAVKPIIPEEELAELGRKMLRRLVDNWHRWRATLDAWREFLAGLGHDGRGQDTFGTLMAVADLIIDHDAFALGFHEGRWQAGVPSTAWPCEVGPAAEKFDAWAEHLAPAALSEFEDAAENWQKCLAHLMSQQIEAWRGGTRHSVGEVLTEFWEADTSDPNAIKFAEARRLLEQTGLTLRRPKDKSFACDLFVPNQHTMLHKLFKDSKWQGELSAGSWSMALEQAPDGMFDKASARIGGQKYKGLAFPLRNLIVGEEEAQA